MTGKPAHTGDAALQIQQELLAAYDHASRAWLARVQSEVDLWSDLASKLLATRSVPEAMTTYQKAVAQRLKMAAGDGQHLADECQEIMGKVTRSLANRTSNGGSA
jgi:hypothetical protein